MRFKEMKTDQQLLDEIFSFRRKLVREGILEIDDLLKGEVFVCRFERRLAGQHLVEDASECPQVRTGMQPHCQCWCCRWSAVAQVTYDL